MRTVNINSQEDMEAFGNETIGYLLEGITYRHDDLTGNGADYTIMCPLKWKDKFTPAELRRMLRNEVDADHMRIEYINFVKEDKDVRHFSKKIKE